MSFTHWFQVQAEELFPQNPTLMPSLSKANKMNKTKKKKKAWNDGLN